MRLRVSMSEEAYNQKPLGKEVSFMKFWNDDIDLDGFVNNVMVGHTFTNNFNTPTTFYKQPSSNFRSSHYIVYDIDYQQSPMREYVDRLSCVPTFAYETMNSTKENPRFRLVYVFSKAIDNGDIYLSLYDHIKKINQMTGDDSHVRDLSRIFYGSKKDADYILYKRNIYKISDFDFEYKPLKDVVHEEVGFDMELLKEFMSSTFEKFYQNHLGEFINKVSSDLPVVDADTKMIDLPNDFIEVYRRFKKTGSINDGECIKLRDGQSRRRTLYRNMCIRRLITPSITANDLLYDISYETSNYILNDKKDTITMEQLRRIVENAMLTDLTNFKYERKRNRIVNPAYQEKHGGTKRQIAGKARSEEHIKKRESMRDLVMSMYDTSKYTRDNLKIINEELVKMKIKPISERTLRTYKKEL